MTAHLLGLLIDVAGGLFAGLLVLSGGAAIVFGGLCAVMAVGLLSTGFGVWALDALGVPQKTRALR
jgi:hypothetical protein